MKSVGQWINYDYAPGLPSYGLPGQKGDAGHNGNSIFYTSYNILDEAAYLGADIRYNKAPNKSQFLNRQYQNGDYFFDNNGDIYELIDVDFIKNNTNNLDSYSSFLKLCGKINANADNALLTKVDNNRININNQYQGLDIIINNTNYNIDNENIYNLRVISDTANNKGQINFTRFTAVNNKGGTNDMDIIYDTNIDAFKILSNKPIVIDGDITIKLSNTNVNSKIYGYSRIATTDDNINNFYILCQHLTAYNDIKVNDINSASFNEIYLLITKDSTFQEQYYLSIKNNIKVVIHFTYNKKSYTRVIPYKEFKNNSYNFLKGYLSDKDILNINDNRNSIGNFNVESVSLIYNIEIFLKLIKPV